MENTQTRSWITKTLLGMGVAWIMTGCASTYLAKVEDRDELPSDAPQEIQEKYKIRLSEEPKELEKSEKKKNAPLARPKKKVEKKVEKPREPFQYPKRRPAENPIWLHEKLTFEVTYLGVAAGHFTMEVKPFKYMGARKVYHLHGRAVSSKLFELFYRLDDQIESYWDYEGLFSHRFHLILDESKQTRNSLEINDSEEKKTFYWNRTNRKDQGLKEEKMSGDIPSFPQDSLSALYYIRTLPLPNGKTHVIPVVSEGKTLEAIFTVVGREMMKTPLGNRRTIKLQLQTRLDGVAKQQGESFLWLTEDQRRMPVRLEASVKVGTIVAQLKEFELGSPVDE